MKRIITTLLAFLYLATSTSAAISIHYCMGKVVAKSIADKDKCGKCGMKKNRGCCEDKVKLVKTQDSHSFQTANITFTPFIAVLKANYIDVEPAFAFGASVLTTHNNSPPHSSGVSVFIRNCVFRL